MVLRLWEGVYEEKSPPPPGVDQMGFFRLLATCVRKLYFTVFYLEFFLTCEQAAVSITNCRRRNMLLCIKNAVHRHLKMSSHTFFYVDANHTVCFVDGWLDWIKIINKYFQQPLKYFLASVRPELLIRFVVW